MADFKVKDSVQLLHGYTPTMTVSEVDLVAQKTKCVWYDTKKREIKQEWLPFDVLKHTPQKTPINKDELLNAIYGR